MVSIIVPVHNVRDFLPLCIRSIIAQTCSEWELILVDDGSTDDSPEICDWFSAADTRIRTLHTSNCGVSAARNEGLRAARGQWISFIDSDDYVSAAYLADMLAESDDADIVVSGWTQPDDGRSFPDLTIGRDDFLRVFALKAFINVCGKLIRRDTIDKAGAFFDIDVKWAEDSIFFVRILLSSNKVKLLSCSNYFYSHRENSAVASINSYESELSALSAVNSLMPHLVRVCSTEVRKYFGPYLFLLRTFHAVNATDLTSREKLRLLDKIKFDRRHLYYHPVSLKERLVAWLFMTKRWRILLRIYG